DQANANLNRARGELAFAEKDYKRQLDLKQRQSVSQAMEDDALKRLQIAQAVHQDAISKTAAAQRDLERTTVVAPYQGRVRSENVDLGQYVSRGAALASLYATDFAEVRLPLQDEELAYLDVSLANRTSESEGRAQVNLTANFAGQPQRWRGEIVRSEGEIDAVSRMIHLVARVTAPYEPQVGKAPLAVGLFVEAEILGRTLENVVMLPRTAIRGEDQVFLIDQDQRLELRQVSIVRRLGDQVIVGKGLVDGDRICLTAMDDAMPGMRVRIEANESLVTLL
ncbi:MAG: efflux RND transporter periplasmic adaptor subunit, partial [Pseudomonadales bacterium]